MKAAPKGKGLQKRKRLLTALVGLWDATPASDEGDLPVAMKRAVYKAMAGVMTPKQVVTELVVLAKAGLVTASGDEVRCSEARGGADASSDRSRGRSGAAEARGRSGSGVGGEGGDSDSRGGTRAGEGRGSDGGATGRRTRTCAGKRRRSAVEYAESEQESDGSEAGDWD